MKNIINDRNFCCPECGYRGDESEFMEKDIAMNGKGKHRAGY